MKQRIININQLRIHNPIYGTAQTKIILYQPNDNAQAYRLNIEKITKKLFISYGTTPLFYLRDDFNNWKFLTQNDNNHYFLTAFCKEMWKENVTTIEEFENTFQQNIPYFVATNYNSKDFFN